MIKITSFYPFSGWLRVTQEFHEDKVIVKTKSLTIEHENEFSYNLITAISDSYRSSGGQEVVGFWALVGLECAFLFFYKSIYANPLLLGTLRALIFVGIFLFVSGFKKQWLIYLLYKDRKIITYIKQNRYNQDAILQVINMIMSKSDRIEEISTASPFPESGHIYEHTYYNFSRLEKTIDRFYADEVIGFQKSPFAESVYSIKYNILNGNTFEGKSGEKVYELVVSFGTFILIVTGVLRLAFDFLPRLFVTYTLYAYVFFLIASFLLQFIKRKTFGFYGKNERVVYWAYTDQKEKQKIENIIEFVQSRILAENKEASLKEIE